MYNFTNTTERGNKTLPSEAINIDGFFLDRELECYTTLAVDGRESLEVSMDNYAIPRKDGVRVRNKALKERELIVNYEINAEDVTKFYETMKKLKKHLYKEKPLKIFFNDEPNLYYEGHLQSINGLDNGYIKGTGSFVILCPTPYKYRVNSTKIVRNGSKINILSDYNFRIRTIKINQLYFESTQMFINIGGFKMSFKTLPKTKGKSLVIDFSKLSVELDGQKITSNLDIMSDFGNIRVKDDDIIKCSLLDNLSNLEIDIEEYEL